MSVFTGTPSGEPDLPRTRFLRLLIAAVTVGLLVASSVQAALGHRDIAVVFALGAPLGISAWGFARGGHHEAAVVLLCAVLVTVTTMVLHLSPLGAHDHAIAIYTGVLFFASVLLTRSVFAWLAAFTLGAGALVITLELMGLTHSTMGRLMGWRALTDFLVFNGVVAGLARAMAEIVLGDRLAESSHAGGASLANREQFLARAAERLRSTDPAPGFGVLAIADLDAFRRVNHVVGHAAADRILMEAGARVARLGADGIVGRIGDDEFALLVTGLGDAAAVESVTRSLRDALCFEHAGVSVRATTGYASYPDDGQGIDSLLLAADNTLAKAKSGGD